MGGRRRGSFTNAFSNNLNTVNLKVFPSHGGRQTCKPILIYSWVLWLKGFKGRVKLSFPLVDPGLEYLYIWKVNTTNRGWNLKNTFCILCLWGCGFHVKLVLFFDILSNDLFFDVLIMGLFEICLFMSQTLGEVG